MCPQNDRPCDRFYASLRGCGDETCAILDRAKRAERERDHQSERAYHWRDIALRAQADNKRLREVKNLAERGHELLRDALAALSADEEPSQHAKEAF